MATKPILKKTTEELQIDCAVAAEVLAECMAFCARELSEERDAESPNLQKIETLEKQAREFKQQRMALGVDNIELINRFLYFYASLLKKRAAV